MELFLIFFTLALCIISFGYVIRHYEKSEWNGGKCKECGGIWYAFDTDSQGGRGYKCDHGHYIWISWLNERPIDPKGILKR